jgi:hypothetical protein
LVALPGLEPGLFALRGRIKPPWLQTSGRHAGEPWQHSQQRHWIKLACKAAEIPPIGFHCATRHSFASILAAKKTPMPVIARLLGHANGDTRMVEKHYAHLDDDYVTAVALGNPILLGDPNALAGVYVSFGGSSVVASPTTSFLVTPGKPALISLAEVGSPTYIACLGGVGNVLLIQYLNL